MKEKQIVEKIKETIERVTPYLKNDGGDIEFKRFEKGIVYVSLIGACHGCPMASYTLEDGIESVLVNEIPEVIKVVSE